MTHPQEQPTEALPLWRVELRRTSVETATVFVRAADQASAEDRAEAEVIDHAWDYLTTEVAAEASRVEAT